MNQKRKIILASTSPRRKEILSKTDLEFKCAAAAFEEDMTLAMDPWELAKYLSHGKAHSLAPIHQDAIIIGADTFIVHENKLLGKPKTAERAREMLATLSGRQHSVLTGVSLIDTQTQKRVSHVSETKVFFRPLAVHEIDAYVATGEPLDKAGAYAIQGGAAGFIEKIEGDFYTVMGLPLDDLLSLLSTEFNVQAVKCS